MFCTNCGTEYNEGLYCTKCGQKLPEKKEKKTILITESELKKIENEPLPNYTLKKDNNMNSCGGWGCFLVFIVIGLIGLGLDNSGNTNSYERHDNSSVNYEAGVYALCQQAVKNNLNYPNSAKFPWGYSGHIIESSNGIYTLNRYVDAQNSFGMETRTYFTCKARISGDKAVLVDLDMDY